MMCTLKRDTWKRCLITKSLLSLWKSGPNIMAISEF